MFVPTLQGSSRVRPSLQIENFKRYIKFTFVCLSVTSCQRLKYRPGHLLRSTKGFCCKGAAFCGVGPCWCIAKRNFCKLIKGVLRASRKISTGILYYRLISLHCIVTNLNEFDKPQRITLVQRQSNVEFSRASEQSRAIPMSSSAEHPSRVEPFQCRVQQSIRAE